MAISNTGTGPPPKGAPGYLRLRLRNDRLRAAGWRTVAWQNGGGLTQDVSWPEALAPLRCGQPAPGLTRPVAAPKGPGAPPPGGDGAPPRRGGGPGGGGARRAPPPPPRGGHGQRPLAPYRNAGLLPGTGLAPCRIQYPAAPSQPLLPAPPHDPPPPPHPP